MKKKLFIAMLLVLTLVSCNKRKISKETNTTNLSSTVMQRSGFKVGTVAGFSILPTFSPPHYFLNPYEIPFKATVINLDFTKLTDVLGDFDATKTYFLLVDTSSLNAGGNTIDWQNAVKVPIADGLSSTKTKATVLLSSPWKLSKLLPNSSLYRELPVQLRVISGADTNGSPADEQLMGDLHILVPFVPEFTTTLPNVATAYTISSTTNLSTLNANISDARFTINLNPNAALTAHQLTSGSVYGLGINVFVNCLDGSTRSYRPQNASATSLFPITYNMPIVIEIELGSVCAMSSLLIKSYVYNSSNTADDTINQVLTVEDFGINQKTIDSADDLLSLTGQSGRFILSGDIDLSAYIAAHGGSWTPITGFTGVLDGNGNTISGLTINNPMANNQGLFDQLTGTASAYIIVQNLNIITSSIVGGNYTGVLAGQVQYAKIRNITINGGSVTGRNQTGGLVGIVTNSILDGITVTETVTSIDPTIDISGGNVATVGGMVGTLGINATLSNSTAGENSRVTGLNNIGGLVGYAQGKITHCSSSNLQIQVSNIPAGTQSGQYGGLVGNCDACIIQTSYATGSVVAGGSTGGLVGFVKNRGSISNSFATGDVIYDGSNRGAAGYAQFGGLVGYMQSGSISNTYATGSIKESTANTLVAHGQYYGSLVGYGCGETPRKTNNYALTGNISIANGAAGNMCGGTLTASQLTGTAIFNGWSFGTGNPWATFVVGQWPTLN